MSAIPCRSDGRYPWEERQAPSAEDRYVAMVRERDTDTLLDCLDVVGGTHEFLAHVLEIMEYLPGSAEERQAVLALNLLMIKNMKALIDAKEKEIVSAGRK